MCNYIREQRNEQDMQQVLTPSKKKKRERGQPEPRQHRFKLPLAKLLCDDVTKFSKFIKLLVQITSSSSIVLSNVLQRKLLQSLFNHCKRVAGKWVTTRAVGVETTLKCMQV